MENTMILYGKGKLYKHLFNLIDGKDVAAAIKKISSTAEKFSLSGNVIQGALALEILNDENAFSLSCEKREIPTGSIYKIALNDISVLRKLFFYNYTCGLSGILQNYICHPPVEEAAITQIGQIATELTRQLCLTANDEEFIDVIAKFYRDFGLGKFGLNKAFVVKEKGDDFSLLPVTKLSNVTLDDLWGYETQKEQLCRNTTDFVLGKSANNCLLYGAAGTGKSTCVKAVLNKYWSNGLRIVEINKNQFRYLSAVIDSLKDRNYRFIIYIDDLSFEDFEVEYKFLKSVIEGGLAPKPSNVLIYATSNRRHLIKETWSDRNDTQGEIHHSDTVAEKLSLAERFGVAISFMKPVQKEYQQIVLHLAKRAKINIPDDELLDKARVWELRHGGMSGRIARQFIDSLGGTE